MCALCVHSLPTVDELDRAARIEGGIYEDSKKEKEQKRKDDKKMQKLQERLHTDDERMFFCVWRERDVWPSLRLEHHLHKHQQIISMHST